jgi:protein phosphatase
LPILVQGGEEHLKNGIWSKKYESDTHLKVTYKGGSPSKEGDYKFLEFWSRHPGEDPTISVEVKKYDPAKGIEIDLGDAKGKVYIILYFEEVITLKIINDQFKEALNTHLKSYDEGITFISKDNNKETSLTISLLESLGKNGAVKLGLNEDIKLEQDYDLSIKPLELGENERYTPVSCSLSGKREVIDRNEKVYIVKLGGLNKGSEIILEFSHQIRYTFKIDFPENARPPYNTLDKYFKVEENGKDVTPDLVSRKDYTIFLQGSEVELKIWLNETEYKFIPENVPMEGELYKPKKQEISVKPHLPETSIVIEYYVEIPSTHNAGKRTLENTTTNLLPIKFPADLGVIMILVFISVFVPAYLLLQRQRRGGATLLEVRPKRIGVVSDVGGRDLNEDVAVAVDVSASFLSRPFMRSLLIVADGIGGLSKGEVASSLCVRNLAAALLPALLAADLTPFNLERTMVQAVKDANAKIYSMVKGDPKMAGMGTTVTAALICGHHAYIANVGDSRAYIIRGGRIRQVTRDHSLVQEMIDRGEITWSQAKFHPKRNVITRAVGYLEKMDVDLFHVELQPGDMLLLSTDGLHSKVDDWELGAIASKHEDPQQACLEMVSLAKSRGSTDNISVILARI